MINKPHVTVERVLPRLHVAFLRAARVERLEKFPIDGYCSYYAHRLL